MGRRSSVRRTPSAPSLVMMVGKKGRSWMFCRGMPWSVMVAFVMDTKRDRAPALDIPRASITSHHLWLSKSPWFLAAACIEANSC